MPTAIDQRLRQRQIFALLIRRSLVDSEMMLLLLAADTLFSATSTAHRFFCRRLFCSTPAHATATPRYFTPAALPQRRPRRRPFAGPAEHAAR